MDSNLVSRRLNKANAALTKLKSAKHANELSDAWEQLLSEFKRRVVKAIEIGKRDPHSQTYAEKLRKASKEDIAIIYLFEARNALNHDSRRDIADYSSTIIDIANGRFHIEGPVENFNIYGGILGAGHDGQPSHIRIGPQGIEAQRGVTVPVKTTPGRVGLRPITSEKGRFGGQPIAPPSSFDGKTIIAGDAIELAEAAVDFLRSVVEQLRPRFPNI